MNTLYGSIRVVFKVAPLATFGVALAISGCHTEADAGPATAAINLPLPSPSPRPDLTDCAFLPVRENQDLFLDADYPPSTTQPCSPSQHPRCQGVLPVQEFFEQAQVDAASVIGIEAAPPFGAEISPPFRVDGNDPGANVSGGAYLCLDGRAYVHIFTDVNDSDAVLPVIALRLASGATTNFRLLLPPQDASLSNGDSLGAGAGGGGGLGSDCHLCDGLGIGFGGGLRPIPAAHLPYTVYANVGRNWGAVSLGDYRDGAIALGAQAYVASYAVPAVTYAANGATLRVRIRTAFLANGNPIDQIWTDHGSPGQLRAGSRNLLYSVAAGVASADTVALDAANGELNQLTLVSCQVARGNWRDNANHIQPRMAMGLNTKVTAWDQSIYIPMRAGARILAVPRGTQKISVQCFPAPRNCDLVGRFVYQ